MGQRDMSASVPAVKGRGIVSMSSGLLSQSPSRLFVLEVWRLQLWWSLGTRAEVVSDEKEPGCTFGWGVGALVSASILWAPCVH